MGCFGYEETGVGTAFLQEDVPKSVFGDDRSRGAGEAFVELVSVQALAQAVKGGAQLPLPLAANFVAGETTGEFAGWG